MKIYFISKKSTCLKWTNGHSNNDYTTTKKYAILGTSIFKPK